MSEIALDDLGAPEKIICASIRYNGKNYNGWRHSTIMVEDFPEVFLEDGLHMDQYIQGFLTSLGRFVNRNEGAQVAMAAGQTPRRLTPSDDDRLLISEELY